jgi:hypothetical protein
MVILSFYNLKLFVQKAKQPSNISTWKIEEEEDKHII